MERPLVLVVDDQEANRELCREALVLHGYEVVTASGVREAEAILAAREVEAVVSDVSMPHNGVRVYEYLLQNHPELRGRFIFMTGSAENFARVKKLPEVARCLLKPFSIQSLVEAMKAALRA